MSVVQNPGACLAVLNDAYNSSTPSKLNAETVRRWMHQHLKQGGHPHRWHVSHRFWVFAEEGQEEAP